MGPHHLVVCFCIAAASTPAAAQAFQPYEGQPGKDVVWVPTSRVLVEKMLDLAGVTAKDFVMDLGSGDGRMVIAAAKRGARAVGVEYEPDMVALARKNAQEAGVAERAQFIEGDMYEADISRATVLALFLLPGNLHRLVPKFVDLPAGTRIITNSYRIEDWPDDEQLHLTDCITWCTAYLYLVPAKVEGAWRLPAGELRFKQNYRILEGVLIGKDGRETKVDGTVTADRVRFNAGLNTYTGRLHGERISGQVSGASGGAFSASRVNKK